MEKNLKDSLVISNNVDMNKEFNIGAKTYIKVQKNNNKFKIVKKTNGELLADDVIVQKSGDDLILSYQDGSTVIFESFYKADASLELPSKDDGILTLDSSTLTNNGFIYAYGDTDTLLSMSDTSLHSSINQMLEFSELSKFAEASSVGTDASISNSSTVSLGTTALSSLALVGIVVASTGGGGGSSSQTPVSVAKKNGLLLDSAVGGVDYYINGQFAGKTKSDGSFEYQDGDRITFKIGNMTLGELTQIPADGRVLPQDLAGVDRGNFTDASVILLAKVLQTLDSDGNASNGIDIGDLSKLVEGINTTLTDNTDINSLFDNGVTIVADDSALSHLKDTISTFMEVDRTPSTTPTISLTNDNGTAGDKLTNDALLTFSAKASDVTRVFKVDGVDASSYVAPTTDGVHTVIVTDTDTAGNAVSSSYEFTLDKTIATPTVTLSTDSGASNSDNITNIAGLTLSTLENGVARTFAINGGTATSTYTEPTTSGDYSVVVTDTDVAGNVSTVTKTFILDKTLPTAPTATLTTDSGSSASDVITNVAGLTLSTLENGVARTFAINGGTATSTYTEPTTDGVHTVIVTDTDTAGNAVSSSYEFTLDKTLNITSPITVTPIVENSGTSQVIYTASSDESGSVIYGLKDGGDKSLLTIDSTNGKVTLTANPDFETKSTYNFTVIATDIAGNVSEKELSLAVTDIDDRLRTGYTTTNFDGFDDNAWSLQLDASGNIYLGGSSFGDFALAKYIPNGELDTSFGGGDGMITTDFGSFDFVNSLQLDASGNIYLGGSGLGDFALAKYTPNGELDTSFGGGDGMITTDFGDTDFGESLQLDSSGNIYLGGWSDASGTHDFALAKYTSNGELDTSFGGGDGMITTDFGDKDYAYSLQFDSNGNIYLGGGSGNDYDESNFALAKYTSNGELDTSFGGGDGMITTDFGDWDEAFSLQLDSSGNIYLAGNSYVNGNDDFALAKYTPNGELDTSFGGGDGMITTDFGDTDFGESLQLDSSGNIYLGGWSDASGTHDFALAKYTSNGELDTSFGGGDGMITTDFGDKDYAYSLQFDSNGNIYLGGRSDASGTYDFALAKYTPNGELDTSFGDLVHPVI